MQPRVETPYWCFRTRVKKSKRENTAQVKLTDTLLSLVLCQSSNFLKRCFISEAGTGSIFRQRTWWTTWIVILNHQTPQKRVLKYIPENRSSRRVKCTLVQALRLCTGCMAHRGSRGIALLFLDHGTRREWGVSVTPRPLFTAGNTWHPLYRRLGGPQGQCRKSCPYQDFFLANIFFWGLVLD